MSTSPNGSADDSPSHDRPGADASGADHDDTDSRTERICYRCDRPIECERWFGLITKPGPGVDGVYESVSRPCCPHCVAAVGMLELVADPQRSASD